MSSIEILAIIASLGGVILSMAKKSLAWVCNIIASSLYGYVFYQNGLYSDMELQGFFILMALIGGATHVIQWPVQRAANPRGGANLIKPVVVRIAVCNSTA